MTAEPLGTRIKCDSPGCPIAALVTAPEPEARGRLHAQGWATMRVDGGPVRDLCPLHRPWPLDDFEPA